MCCCLIDHSQLIDRGHVLEVFSNADIATSKVSKVIYKGQRLQDMAADLNLITSLRGQRLQVLNEVLLKLGCYIFSACSYGKHEIEVVSQLRD